MFRPIGDRLTKHAAAILRRHDAQQAADTILHGDLLEAYGITAGAVEISYNERHAYVRLTARTKALANELTFLAPKLIASLKEKGMRVNRILIR